MNHSQPGHRMRTGRAVKRRPRYHGDMKVILASRSPRRLALLQSAGLTVGVRPADIDESPLPDEAVEAMVERLSHAKASACHAPAHIPVIAADTLVAIGSSVLGQPGDIHEAGKMLQQLSGRSHRVLTSVCVRLGGRYASKTLATRVRFRSLSRREIDTYLLHNDVLDKAGAYAIQAGAASFIEAISGPLDNVIGLPVQATLNMIACLKSDSREKMACE